jgi:hypothetical protein
MAFATFFDLLQYSTPRRAAYENEKLSRRRTPWCDMHGLIAGFGDGIWKREEECFSLFLASSMRRANSLAMST